MYFIDKLWFCSDKYLLPHTAQNVIVQKQSRIITLSILVVHQDCLFTILL